MKRGYEKLPEPRFVVEQVEGVEQIRIRARRQIFVLIFLPFWLTMWTIGGVTALFQFFATHEPFLALWLCFWALGWVFAAATIGWMLFGSETLRVSGGDLEIAHHLLSWSRRRTYQGAQTRNLRAGGQPPFPFRMPAPPFLRRGATGAVRFDYGARTVYAATGLDDAEGQMIVDRLVKRLPAGAKPN